MRSVVGLLSAVSALLCITPAQALSQSADTSHHAVALELAVGVAMQNRHCTSCPDQIGEPQWGPIGTAAFAVNVAPSWRARVGGGTIMTVLPVVFDAHASYGTRMTFAGFEYAPLHKRGDFFFADMGYAWHSMNGDAFASGPLVRGGVRVALSSAHPATGIALTVSQALAGTHPPSPNQAFPGGSYKPTVVALEFNVILP